MACAPYFGNPNLIFRITINSTTFAGASALTMKKIFLSALLAFSFVMANAQVPQSLTYQGIARNAAGTSLTNQSISIRITIKDVSANGPTLYSETHSVTTNQFGLFTLAVGTGLVQSGNFSTIPWGVGLKFMKVEMDVTGGASYVDMGTNQLLSVPYALYAGSVVGGGAGDDWGAQTASTNSTISGNGAGTPLGIAQQGAASGQVLKWNGTSWVPSTDLVGAAGGDNWGTQTVVTNSTLTGGGTFASPLGLAQQGATVGQTLKWNGSAWAPANDIDNDGQTLAINGNIVTISNGNSITLPAAINYSAGTGINIVGTVISNTGDLSNTNELQTLSIAGNQLTISNGNSVSIPTGTNYSAGVGIDITGTVISNTAPDQTVSITGTGGATVTGAYPNFTINSADAQTLSIAGSQLTISGGNAVTLPAGTTYTSGTGINILGNVISNSQPDQVVTLNGAGATTVTGLYPNFTITSTDNNTTYANGSGLDLTGTTFSLNAVTDATLSGNGTAGTPLMIAQQGAVNGQTLKWNGATWIPANDLDNDAQTLSLNGQIISISNGNSITLPVPVSYTAGTGIGIAGTVITNTAPDQIVALTGTGSTTITGAYPNFTINSVDIDAQTLSLLGSTLTISNGNSVSLPAPVNYIAGTGIGIVGTVITNSAPDQVVTLTGIGGTIITGAYPNFTINSIDLDAQTLSLVGSNLTISNGNTIALPTGTTYTAGTGIGIAGNIISNTSPDQIVTLAGTGGASILGAYPNFTINTTDNDAQTLTVVGNNLTISNGNTVAIPGTTYTAGTGIGIAGNVITNTAPDQIVTLTGTGATNILGAYPNFTVNSIDTDTDAQTLSLVGSTLSISNGNSVLLTTGSTYTAGSGISLAGTVFSNNAITDATLSGNGTAGTPLKIAQQGATNGQVLQWNGTTWLPGTVGSVSTSSPAQVVYSTGTIAAGAAWQMVPGLTITVNVPAVGTYRALVAYEGGAQTTSPINAGGHLALSHFIDGALIQARSLMVDSPGNFTDGLRSFGYTSVTDVLTPGPHTIDVEAFLLQGNPISIGAATNLDFLRCSLSVVLLQQ